MHSKILKNSIAVGKVFKKTNFLMIIKTRLLKNTFILMTYLFLIINCSQNRKIKSFNEKALMKRNPLRLESDYYDYHKQKRFTEKSRKQYENVLFFKGFDLGDMYFYAGFRFKLRRGMSSEELLAKSKPLEIKRYNTPDGSKEKYYYGFTYDDVKQLLGVVTLVNGKVIWWAHLHHRYPLSYDGDYAR